MRKIMLLVAFLSFIGMQAFAQTTITGTVTDSNDEPIPGVNVSAKGFSNVGTITDLNGNYTLSVPADATTLIFSFVGMKRQEVEIGGRTTINVQMENEDVDIEEIVVTGVASGTSTKKLGFSVAKIDEEAIQEVPANDAGNALRGKVSGVTVVQGSGNPIAAPAIRLRGSTAIQGSQSPLIIVDGVITNGSLNDINMQDVKSIEIVKGSAGSSLYGSLAGNGVIQIITKRGSEHSGLVIDFNNEIGMQDLAKKYPLTNKHPYLLNDEGTDFVYANNDTSLDNRILDYDHMFDNNYPGTIYDQQERVFKPQLFYTNYLSVSSNAEKINFNTSFENSSLGGVIDGVDPYERKSLRLNLDLRPNDAWKFSFSGNYVRVDGRNQTETGQGSNIFYSTLILEPLFDILADNPDGTPYIARFPNTSTNASNPLYESHNRKDKVMRDRFIGGISADWQATDWLSFRADYSMDKTFGSEELFYRKGYLTSNPQDVRQFGSLSLYNYTKSANIYSVSTKLEKKFGLLNTTFVLKYLHEQYKYVSDRTYGDHFTADVKRINAVPNDQLSVSSWEQETLAENVFANLKLDFDDKLIFDGLVRNDGSSRFGENNRYKIYYRGGLAYRLTEDIDIPYIQELKLRVSYGTSGNRPRFTAQYETYSVSSDGISPNILGNKELKPSENAELETGINITFLKKWNFEFNYAYGQTKDQIILVPLSAVAGYRAQWRNAGDVENKSLEFSLFGNVIRKSDFSWDIGITWDRNRQMITELGAPAWTRNIGSAPVFRVEAGEPFGVMYGTQIATSLDQLLVDENGYVLNNPDYGTNDHTINDYTINSDGYVILAGTENTVLEQPLLIVDETGQVMTKAIGNSNPDFRMGFNSTFMWKGIGFYMLWEWKQGGDVYNYTRQLLYYNNRHGDFDEYAAQGKKADYINSSSVIYNKASAISHFVEDGTYWKLREVSISYTLQASQLGKVGNVFKQIKMGLHGRNLWTISDYKGFDPEVALKGDTNWAYDEYVYPNFRSYSFSLKLKF